jgi:DNA-binding LacI/PurR family transcriptional regulator
MSLVCFITPDLTTIRQRAYETGKLDVEVLLHHIGKKSVEPLPKILESSLVIRESTTMPLTRKEEHLETKALSASAAS